MTATQGDAERGGRITAERYDGWSEARCAGIEVVDAKVVARAGASIRHNRLARFLANRYREGDVFTGVVKAAVPFPVEVGLGAV